MVFAGFSMTDTISEEKPTTSWGVLAFTHLLALAGTWISVVLLVGDGFYAWYIAGGFWMYALALLSLLQTGVGITAGLINLRRPLPLYLHLAVPALAAAAGLTGALMGLDQARAALASAPPDMQLRLWGTAVDIAGAPKQLGLLIAGWGMLAASATAGLRLSSRARFDAPSIPAVIFGVVGLGLVAIASAVAIASNPQLISGREYSSITLVHTLLLLLGLMVCLFFVSLGARGVLAPAAISDPKYRAACFSTATLGAIAPFCWVTSVGAAIASFYEGSIYAFVIRGPADVAELLLRVDGLPRPLLAFANATTLLDVAAILIGVGLIWLTRGCLIAWLRFRALEVAAIVGFAIALTAIEHARETTLNAGLGSVATASKTWVPDGLRLATSTSRVAPGELHVVVLEDGRVSLDGRPLGRADVDATFTALAARLTEPEPGSEGRAEKKEAKPEEEDRAADGAERGGEKPTVSLPCVAIAIDRRVDMSTATDFARRLCPANDVKWTLLVQDVQPRPWQTKEGRQLRTELGALGDFLVVTAGSGDRLINLDLRCEPEEGGDAVPEPPSLWIRFQPGEVHLIGPEDPFVHAKIPLEPDKGISEKPLRAELSKLKDLYPESRRIAIEPAGGKWVQDLVTLFDMAREDATPGREGRIMFDQPVWVVPP